MQLKTTASPPFDQHLSRTAHRNRLNKSSEIRRDEVKSELVLTPFSSQGRFPRSPAVLQPPEPKVETQAPPNCLLPMIEGPAVEIQCSAILVGQQHRLPERHNCRNQRGGGGLYQAGIIVCPKRQGSGNPWTKSGHHSLLISPNYRVKRQERELVVRGCVLNKQCLCNETRHCAKLENTRFIFY